MNAKVTAFLTKDDQEHKVVLQHEGAGKYKGFISLPESGPWKLIVFADYQDGHNEELNQIHIPAQNVLGMDIDVQPADKPNIVVWAFTGIAVIIVGLILLKYIKKVSTKLPAT